MLDPTRDDTQRMLRDSVASFVARESDLGRARRTRREEGGFSRVVWQRMAENGWLGLLLGEQVGGLGLGFAEAAVLFEELGRGLVPEPVAASAVLAGRLLAESDDAELKAELLPRLIGGTCLPAVAWQERANRYAPADVTTTAAPSGSAIELSGEKHFVPGASVADGFLVSARAPQGLAVYWVERAAPGIALTSHRTVDGVEVSSVAFRATPAHSLALGAEVDAVLSRALDEARLCVAAELVGVMSQALATTLDYVKQREQFGQPIGKFQALQHRLVDLWIQTELGRSSVLRAVEVFDHSADPHRRAAAASAAKARCSEAALLVTRQGIQLHGGMGYTDGCDIGLFLKRALLLSSWLGNAAVHRRRFAELVD